MKIFKKWKRCEYCAVSAVACFIIAFMFLYVGSFRFLLGVKGNQVDYSAIFLLGLASVCSGIGVLLSIVAYISRNTKIRIWDMWLTATLFFSFGLLGISGSVLCMVIF